MNQERLLTILKGPHFTEKSMSTDRQHVFKVATYANKTEIKAAVEMLFQVTVESVKTINVKGKQTYHRQIKGRRKNWKKAYVKLAEGQELQLAGGDY